MIKGGCQCGTLRYAVDAPLGRASVCHCRMCQKAMAAPFGAFVDAPGLTWVRGTPAYYQSSNKVRRGFCSACGTPLTFEWSGAPINVAIFTLDDPDVAAPVIQVGIEGRRPWVNETFDLPVRPAQDAPWLTSIISNQHPDHDTADGQPAIAPARRDERPGED